MQIANHTQKSVNDIREAWAEFKADISNPVDAMLLAAAMLFLAVLIALPFLGGAHFQ